MPKPARWVQIGPLIEARVLHIDGQAGTHLSLIRMHPDAVIGSHRHDKDEHIVVLEGECRIGAHRLAAGDMHVASVGSWHDRVTTDAGALFLLRGQYPYPG